jgi:CO dehydrogenase maturation factor
MEALLERPGYSLLAMGRSESKGCYCPANRLLQDSIDLVADSFSVVLIDAEAGLEQINRQVTRRVNQIIAMTDGSQRSMEVVVFISEMIGREQVVAVGNRLSTEDDLSLPEGIELVGVIPEDKTVRQFDREGRSLWELPADDVALLAVKRIARKVVLDSRCSSWAISA